MLRCNVWNELAWGGTLLWWHGYTLDWCIYLIWLESLDIKERCFLLFQNISEGFSMSIPTLWLLHSCSQFIKLLHLTRFFINFSIWACFLAYVKSRHILGSQILLLLLLILVSALWVKRGFLNINFESILQLLSIIWRLTLNLVSLSRCW